MIQSLFFWNIEKVFFLHWRLNFFIIWYLSFLVFIHSFIYDYLPAPANWKRQQHLQWHLDRYILIKVFANVIRCHQLLFHMPQILFSRPTKTVLSDLNWTLCSRLSLYLLSSAVKTLAGNRNGQINSTSREVSLLELTFCFARFLCLNKHPCISPPLRSFASAPNEQQRLMLTCRLLNYHPETLYLTVLH